MGQCTANLNKRIESNAEFDKIEEDYDVVKLIELIRKLSYGEVETKYVFCTILMEMRKLSNIRKKQNESLIAYSE